MFEIERKFIIRIPETLPEKRAAMAQTYLVTDAGTERVRKVTDENGVRYFHTAKKRVTDMTAEERERQIDRAAYEQYLTRRDPARRTVEKTRYYYPYKGLTFEIDVYPFWTRQCVMEVELEREDQPVAFPPDIEILREVTGEKAYKNVSLAKRIPEEIAE